MMAAILGTITVAWLVTLSVSYVDTRHEIEEILDAHLAQTAALLAAEAGHELAEIDTEDLPKLHRYGRKLAFQVWENGHTLRLHSPNAPRVLLSQRQEGFSNTIAENTKWRVFSLWDDRKETLVQVGERRGARDEIALGIATTMLWPLLVALPVLALLVWVAITKGLRPLAQLGEQVAAREPANLAPLDATGAPSEVAPLADKLNKLFERVRSSIESEQRFTADAAHELRTPLAAIRAQAQVARASSTDVERSHALDWVVRGCDRASHLVDQLLTLARIDAAPSSVPLGPVDLRAVASTAIADLVPAALDNGIEFDLSEGPAAEIAGEPGLVRILVSNLLDNAIRYSPPGGKVSVDVATVAERPTLTVNDQGPGIPPEQREQVWQRFFRIPGSAADGSGLGLSIVERIAQLHGAAVTLEDGENGSGLRVTVAFPRPGLGSIEDYITA